MNIFSNFFFYSDWALFVARLVLGVVLLRHGWPKIKDLKKNAENFSKMGFHPGFFWGSIAAVLESFGGAAVILGLWVPLVALLFGFEMLVVVFWNIFVWKRPFSEYEFELALFGLSLLLSVFGSGYLSAASGTF
jgi:putative oxidoreductase